MGGVTYPVPQFSSRVLPGIITSSVETIPLGITGFPQFRAEDVRFYGHFDTSVREDA